MIAVTSLMLGNYIITNSAEKGVIGRVAQISKNRVSTNRVSDLWVHDLEGIEITTPILYDAGFICGGTNLFSGRKNDCWTKWGIDDFWIWYNERNFRHPSQSDNIELKYVHELQNLYYHFTGKHLTIKL